MTTWELQGWISVHYYYIIIITSKFSFFNVFWINRSWIISRSFPSPHFFHGVSMVWVNLGFICLKNLVPELSRGFQMSSGNSDLAILFFSVISRLYLVVNPPFYLLRCHLIIDYDSDRPPSSRVFLTWVDIMKGCKHLFGLCAESSKDQLPKANSSFGTNSRSCICLINHGKIEKQATPGNKSTSQSIVQLPLSIWVWFLNSYLNVLLKPVNDC